MAYVLNPLKPNDLYIGRTAPLTFRRCIVYIFIQQIYVLNILNMLRILLFFSLRNAVYFTMLTCLVPVLFAFYIQGVLNFKCKILTPKGSYLWPNSRIIHQCGWNSIPKKCNIIFSLYWWLILFVLCVTLVEATTIGDRYLLVRVAHDWNMQTCVLQAGHSSCRVVLFGYQSVLSPR